MSNVNSLYLQSLKDRGLVRVEVWVPKNDREAVIKLAKALRDTHKDNQIRYGEV